MLISSLFWHTQGFFRYWTPKVKKWLVELSQAEAEKETKLKGILQRLVGSFCEHHNKWRQLVSATAGFPTNLVLVLKYEIQYVNILLLFEFQVSRVIYRSQLNFC